MSKRPRWLLALAGLLLLFGMLAPPATAEPPTAQSLNPVLTTTNQVVWVHQCAEAACGFHEVPKDRNVVEHCWVRNEGIVWGLVITAHPAYPDLPIAGFVAEYALNYPHTLQRCGNVGERVGMVWPETWVHSCPLMNCGYGSIKDPDHLHDVAAICQTGFYEGHRWALELDHSHLRSNLSGFMHVDDLRGPVPSNCWWS